MTALPPEHMKHSKICSKKTNVPLAQMPCSVMFGGQALAEALQEAVTTYVGAAHAYKTCSPPTPRCFAGPQPPGVDVQPWDRTATAVVGTELRHGDRPTSAPQQHAAARRSSSPALSSRSARPQAQAAMPSCNPQHPEQRCTAACCNALGSAQLAPSIR